MTHKATEMRRVYLLWGISSSDVIYYTFHWTFTKACFDSILQILYLLLGEQTNLFKKNKQYFESENQSFAIYIFFFTIL